MSRSLSDHGIVHCVPYAVQSWLYGETAVKVEQPIFPEYVFVHGGKDDVEAAARIDGVIRVVRPNEDEVEPFQSQVSNLFFAVRSSVPLSSCPPVLGARFVEVCEGPLRGLQGHCANGASELILAVDMLGRAAKLNVAPRLLRAANDIVLRRA